MFSRRNFLINSSVLAASGTALCSPGPSEATAPLPASPTTATIADSTAQSYIRSRRDWLKDHDPRVFLGYPANMNKPSEGFFRWREQLESVEVGARTMNNVGDPFYHPGAINTHSWKQISFDVLGCATALPKTISGALCPIVVPTAIPMAPLLVERCWSPGQA